MYCRPAAANQGWQCNCHPNVTSFETASKRRCIPHQANLRIIEAVSKRLNGKWMDERTEAIIRAESAEAHVVELERYLKAGREEWLLTSKALEQAEAHAADCKRLVTACENDIDAEHMKRLEAEAEVEKWQWIATNACEELAYETHVNPRSPLDIRLARWERGDTT